MEHSAVTVPGTDQVDLNVRCSADGPARPKVTYLLLHGWPGTGADWDAVVPLAHDHVRPPARYLAPDLRGFGASGRPAADVPARYGPVAHVEDLRAVLDHFDAERVVVAGYDLGATLAQHLARADRRVAGLVLGCPPYPGVGERRFEPAIQAELWYQQLHLQPWASELVAHDRATVAVYLRHFYSHWWGDGQVEAGHFSSMVDAYAAPGAFEESIGWYRARSSSREAPAPAAATVALAQPTVVLWGEKDPVVPIRLADRLDEFFTDLTFRPLPGVGHFVPLEAPEAAAAALAAATRS